MKLRTFLKLALFILPLAFFSTKPVPLANAGILEIDAGASDKEMRKMTPKELLKAIEKMDPSDVEELPWDIKDTIREARKSLQNEEKTEKGEEPTAKEPKSPEIGGKDIGADGVGSAIIPNPFPPVFSTTPSNNLSQPIFITIPFSNADNLTTFQRVSDIVKKDSKKIPEMKPRRQPGKIDHGRESRWPNGIPVQPKAKTAAIDYCPITSDPLGNTLNAVDLEWASAETPKGDIRILTPNIDFVKAIIYLATTLKSHNSQEMAIPLILGALTGGYLSAMGIPANIAQAQPEFAILTDNNYWSELSKPKPDDATIRNLTVLHGKYCCTELDKMDVDGTPNSVVECVPGSQE
jgi:hypothetical protein